MSNSWEIAVRPTPFHHRMAELAHTNQWSQRLGWTLAAAFDTPDTEHAALRNRCTFSDRSALVTYEVTGREASAYLDRLAGGCGGHVREGQSRRVVICNEDGHLIADGCVLRPSKDEWWLVLPLRVSDWMALSATGFDCVIRDISEELACLAVDGPSSCAALLSAGFGGLQALRPGGVRDMKIGSTRCVVTRRSPLGGLGYELRVPVVDALWILDRFRRDASYFSPVPLGTKAADVAQLEAGHARLGVDYASAHVSPRDQRRTPLELGLGSLVLTSDGTFTGRTSLQHQRRQGAPRALVGLEVEGVGLPDGRAVFDGNRKAGHLTSVAWSPSCKHVVGLADLSADVLGTSRDLAVLGPDGSRRGACIVSRPFFVCANSRRTPPDAQ